MMELAPGTTIVVLEEAQSDGHHRARIGVGEWISLRTAAGSVLAIASAPAATAVAVVSQVVAVQPYVADGSPTARAAGGPDPAAPVQVIAQPMDVESVQQPQHVGGTQLGMPPNMASPWPVSGCPSLPATQTSTGTSYTTVAKATVRTGPSLASPVVRQLGPKHGVVVFEEQICDGHHRGRIGHDQWLSIKTAQGKVLAIPGNLHTAQAAPVMCQTTAVVVAEATPVTVAAVTVAPVASSVQPSPMGTAIASDTAQEGVAQVGSVQPATQPRITTLAANAVVDDI